MAVAAAVAGVTGDFHVTLQRLLLVGVKLTDPAGSEPPLWPLGLFDRAGTGLNISDVRLMVDAVGFQKYLSLFQTLPRAVAQYYTVGFTLSSASSFTLSNASKNEGARSRHLRQCVVMAGHTLVCL